MLITRESNKRRRTNDVEVIGDNKRDEGTLRILQYDLNST